MLTIICVNGLSVPRAVSGNQETSLFHSLVKDVFDNMATVLSLESDVIVQTQSVLLSQVRDSLKMLLLLYTSVTEPGQGQSRNVTSVIYICYWVRLGQSQNTVSIISIQMLSVTESIKGQSQNTVSIISIQMPSVTESIKGQSQNTVSAISNRCCLLLSQSRVSLKILFLLYPTDAVCYWVRPVLEYLGFVCLWCLLPKSSKIASSFSSLTSFFPWTIFCRSPGCLFSLPRWWDVPSWVSSCVTSSTPCRGG